MSSEDDQYENELGGEDQDFDDDSEDEMNFQGSGKNGFRRNNVNESDDEDDLEDEGDDDDDDGEKVTAWGTQKKRFYKEGDENLVFLSKLRLE